MLRADLVFKALRVELLLLHRRLRGRHLVGRTGGRQEMISEPLDTSPLRTGWPARAVRLERLQLARSDYLTARQTPEKDLSVHLELGGSSCLKQKVRLVCGSSERELLFL